MSKEMQYLNFFCAQTRDRLNAPIRVNVKNKDPARMHRVVLFDPIYRNEYIDIKACDLVFEHQDISATLPTYKEIMRYIAMCPQVICRVRLSTPSFATTKTYEEFFYNLKCLVETTDHISAEQKVDFLNCALDPLQHQCDISDIYHLFPLDLNSRMILELPPGVELLVDLAYLKKDHGANAEHFAKYDIKDMSIPIIKQTALSIRVENNAYEKATVSLFNQELPRSNRLKIQARSTDIYGPKDYSMEAYEKLCSELECARFMVASTVIQVSGMKKKVKKKTPFAELQIVAIHRESLNGMMGFPIVKGTEDSHQTEDVVVSSIPYYVGFLSFLQMTVPARRSVQVDLFADQPPLFMLPRP